MQFVLCMYLDFEFFLVELSCSEAQFWLSIQNPAASQSFCWSEMYDVIDAVWRQHKQLLKIAGPSYMSEFLVFTSGLRIKSLSDICQSWNRKRWMCTLSVAWVKMRFFHVFHSQHNPVFFQPVLFLTNRRKKKKKVLQRSAFGMRISFV